MIPALAKFIFPTSRNESPSKIEDDSEQLKVITEHNLQDDTESVQSSATLNTSGYSSMKKDELVALATRAGIRLDKKATKAQIIKLLATTSLGINQSTSVRSEQEVDADSVVSQDVTVSTPLRTRGRLTASSRTSELPDVSTNTSPLRTRSSTSKLASLVRTPVTAKSSRAKHELRSPKELRVSHQKALDPQFEYYSAVETIDVNVRMTRSAKKAKSGSRTTPIKRKRSSSISERSASRTTTHASADESEAEQSSVQTGRTRRRATVNHIESPSSTVNATAQRLKSSIEPTTKSNLADQRSTFDLERRQSSDLPVSKRAKKVALSPKPAPVDNENAEESAGDNIEHMSDDQHGSFESVEDTSHSISAAEENHQMEQDILDSLKDTHDQPEDGDSEEDSNNSDDEVDIESAEDDQEVDRVGEDDADQDIMMDDEEDDDNDDEENENSDEEDEDESSNDSEESDSNEDDGDDSDDSEGEVDEGDDNYIAPATYNVPPNSFMAAFLAAGKKTADAMTNEVMDLVSDNDKDGKEEEDKDNKEEEMQPVNAIAEKTIPQVPSFVPTTVQTLPAFSFAPTVPVAVRTIEKGETQNVDVTKESSNTVHPAVEAFNKLGSKLITAAIAAESTDNVSGVEKLSAQEYDLIKSILNKIKPPEVVDQSEDDVNPGQKRALSKNTEDMNDDSELTDTHGQESAIKRRRASTDSRVSYDGGESWNLSHPSGEDPLSPSFNTYPTPRSSIGGVFGRSSFGGGLFGRVQTPYHHNYRASIGSNSGDASAAVSASKAMFDRRIEEAATSFPPHVASTVEVPTTKKSNGVTFNLGSSTTITGHHSNSASKVFGSGGCSSYTPKFRSSAASFVPAVPTSAASRDNSLSLLSAEESSMSYLEKRRQQRQLQASASATVAKQILDTLGSLSSPIDNQPVPIGLLTQEANILKFGSSTVPDFQSKLNASQSSSAANGDGSSKVSSEKTKPSVSFASTVMSSSVTSNLTAPAPKVSFALSTHEDDENSSAKNSKFFAPPTPMPVSSSSIGDRHVKFSADINSKPFVSLMTPASKSSSAGQFSNDQNNDDSFNLAEDDDQVIVVEKKRSSIGSTPFKPSLSSSSIDADEFSFDEPMVVKGVDNDFIGRENIADFRYAFTPPSKPKRSRLATPAANKVNNKPIVDSLKKDSTSSATVTSLTTPNIWNLKPNPNEKKCQVCLVMNDKAAAKCESCGSAFPPTTVTSATTSTPAPVANIWNMKPNPNEKKCQVCLVMNDKIATKCESCGSVFPDTSASSTGTSSSSSVTAPAAFSTSSAVPKTAPAVSGFTFGVTPSSTTAPVATPATTSGTSFSFGVSKPASSDSEASKVTSSAAPAALPKLDSKATFTGFSFGATSAVPAVAETTSSKVDGAKKESSTVAPAISFGITKTDSSKPESSFTTAAKPSASSGGFSFGALSSATLPTIPENIPISQKDEQEDEQPTRKRRVEEDEPVKTAPAPFKPVASISFGAPPAATPTVSGMFGLPASASSSSTATEEKKKNDTAGAKLFGAASTGSFSFGAPTAAPAADAEIKPLFGAPAAPTVTTTALPSFSAFASQSSSSTAVTAPAATATSTAAPAFGASSGAPSSSAATLPPLGSASSAPFNAFAPTAPSTAPASSTSVAPSISAPSAPPAFGATAVPSTESGPFGAFGTTTVSKPAVDTKTSNPFGGFGSVTAPAGPIVSATTAPAAPVAGAAANPFASTFNTAAPAALMSGATTAFPPATTASNPFGAAAVKQPFGNIPAAPVAPAPASNPFASSFVASAAPAPAPVAMSGPFGGASSASAAPSSNPFASSFGGNTGSSTGSTMFGIPTGSAAPSSTSNSSNPFVNSFASTPATAPIPSLTPSSSTNNFAFGAGAGASGMGMGGFPPAPSLTPQTSFSAPTNNFSSNMFGGTGGGLPPNPMMPSGSGGGFSLGAGGAPGGAGGNGQPRKILKIKKKV